MDLDYRIFELHFREPQQVLNAMMECMAVLGGSQALYAMFNTMLPECRTPTSDFDFFLPNNGHMLFRFVMVLQKLCGVKWTSPLDFIQNKLATGGHITLSRSRAELLLEAFDSHWAPRTAGPTMHSIIKELREALSEFTNADSDSEDEDDENSEAVWREFTWKLPEERELTISLSRRMGESYDHTDGLRILRGKTHTGIEVQVMTAPRKSALGHIAGFHSTPVQCFVSPYGSAHMYWDLTESKKAWAWRENSLHGKKGSSMEISRLQRHDASIAKYASRGFEYVERPLGASIRARTMWGKGVKLFPPDATTMDMSSVDKQVIAARLANLEAVCWYERPHDTELLPPPGQRRYKSVGQGDSKSTLEQEDASYLKDIDLFCKKFALRLTQFKWGATDKVFNL